MFDNAVVIALIAGLPAMLIALATLITAIKTKTAAQDNKTAIHDLHIAVNSRLTQLLESTAKASKAEGILEGSQTQTSIV